MVSTGTERRARRAAQRRQQILDAAARVFARKGYERATTREIAIEADLAEGTIYNYFAGKQDLLLALAEGIRLQFEQAIGRLRVEGDPRVEIARGVSDVLGILADNAEVIRGLVTGLWDPGMGFRGYLIPGSQQLIAHVQRLLATAAEQGKLKAHDSELVAQMVVGMVVFLALPHLRRLSPVPTARERTVQAELVASVLLSGLQA
jgi:AcrR family transcriptional regulator